MSKAAKPVAPQKVEYNDAVAESKKYFEGDDLAATVWVSKYALKDSFGNIYETSPKQMHERIAAEIERIERKYPDPMSKEEVFELLDHFRYVIPQGGPMTGIGNNFQVASLSNCFVIGHKNPADSYGGIFRMDEEQVQLMKRRGGVGHDLSHIRPTGSPVLNSALTSTGIVPFMERYSNSTREVAQDGRRGALMLSLSIKHPDAERFIDAKVDTGKVTGANVSIKIDDEFMRAAIAGKKYHQQFPIKSDHPKYEQDIDAKKLWDKIIHNAWKSAEPGVLFWDTIIRESVPDCYADEGFVTVSTNPCGEIPLCPYDSCRLLAMNLLSYVDNPFTKEAKFNFDRFKAHVGKAMRMMDDIIDLELEKVEQIIAKIAADPEDEEVRRVELELWKKIRTMAQKGRRTGLGITAEGDMLAALGLLYGSDEAIAFAVEVQKTLAVEAYRASVRMAAQRGAFPIYDASKEKNNPMIARIREADPELYAEMEKNGRRNIAMLTIAPTGTTSLMSQTTSGIEPVFRTVYKRRRKINPSDHDTHVDYEDETGEKFQEYNVYHHNFVKWLDANGYDTSKLETISDAELNEWVAASPYHGATANDIDWVAKVKMQGAIQKWVDHSISVTVNLPTCTARLGSAAARALRFTATAAATVCCSTRPPRTRKRSARGIPAKWRSVPSRFLPTSCGSRTAPRTGSPSWDFRTDVPTRSSRVRSRRTPCIFPARSTRASSSRSARTTAPSVTTSSIPTVTVIRIPSAASRVCSTKSSGTTPNSFRAYCATACRSRRPFRSSSRSIWTASRSTHGRRASAVR